MSESNLVARLRDDRGDDPERVGRLMEQAALEIERLDADAACEKAEKDTLRLEVERLRAALELIAPRQTGEGLIAREALRGSAFASCPVQHSAGSRATERGAEDGECQ
jgi:hypothetical protein